MMVVFTSFTTPDRWTKPPSAGFRDRERSMQKKREHHGISMADLMGEIDTQIKGFRRGFNPGEAVKGTVVSVGPEFLVVDLHAKIEGIVPRVDLDPETPMPKEGDGMDLFFVEMQGGAARLSPRLGGSGAAVNQSIRHAYETRMPLEGVVEKEVNGGYEVTLAGQPLILPDDAIPPDPEFLRRHRRAVMR